MIIKSHLIEQDISIIDKYKCVLIYGENEGLKKEISLISDKIDYYIKENNLTGTYLDYIVKFVYQRSY